MKFTHILFPVDFSERASYAGPYVEALATQFDAKVTLIHVIEPFWEGMGGEFAAFDTACIQSLKDQLRHQLNTFGVRYMPDVKYDIHIEDGEPSGVITRFAHKQGVDLIMMPSHGYGPFRSMLLGSVTAKVLHDAQCPVWTGAHLETTSYTRHVECRNIICAVDLGSRTVSLMQWAEQLSQSLTADLRFVHAIPSAVESWPDRQFDLEFEEALEHDARERIAVFQKEAGMSAPVCLGRGNVAAVVEQEARRHKADMVIIGRGCIQGKLGRLRTHAYGVIRQAPCPVISI
jgi:nucleotide-binding universal stress UspA family protein